MVLARNWLAGGVAAVNIIPLHMQPCHTCRIATASAALVPMSDYPPGNPELTALCTAKKRAQLGKTYMERNMHVRRVCVADASV